MKIRENAQGIEKLTGGCLIIALVCWAIGITLPILNVTKFLIFEDEVSLIMMVFELNDAGEFWVASIIFVFTIFLPATKLLTAMSLWWREEAGTESTSRRISVLEAVSKWTMLDVMVVALLVVTMKTSWVAEFELAAGLYFFAISALLALAAGIGLKRAATTP